MQYSQVCTTQVLHVGNTGCPWLEAGGGDDGHQGRFPDTRRAGGGSGSGGAPADAAC